MAPAMLMRPGPFALAKRVSPDAPRRAPHSPRLPARLNVRSSVPAVVNTVDASTHRTYRVVRVLRRARVVTRAASTGGVWQWWPSADAWALLSRATFDHVATRVLMFSCSFSSLNARFSTAAYVPGRVHVPARSGCAARTHPADWR